jgi:hypothetical protein
MYSYVYNGTRKKFTDLQKPKEQPKEKKQEKTAITLKILKNIKKR